MRVAVDIDDTLNILDRAGVAGAYIARNNLPFKLQEEHANAFVRVFDWQLEDVLRFIRDGGISTFVEARARKGAAEVLKRWLVLGWEVVILTARPKSWFGNPESISRDWLEKRQIPYSSLAIEEHDKGAYCAEHHISVLVDDNVENCLGAQAHGVYAVLAIGKGNEKRASEICFGSGSWVGLDKAVRRIVQICEWEEGFARACPSRETQIRDGWEYRKDVWRGRQGNCVRPVLPSMQCLEEKVEKYERESEFVCRYRLTECDIPLDRMLQERGYAIEASGSCMVRSSIPSDCTAEGVTLFERFEDWTGDFRSVASESGVLRAYAYLTGDKIFATLYREGAAVAVGMAVAENGVLTLSELCVKPGDRRTGAGRKIANALLDWGRQKGAQSACLQAEDKQAAAFFERLGFVKTYDYWYRIKELRV